MSREQSRHYTGLAGTRASHETLAMMGSLDIVYSKQVNPVSWPGYGDETLETRWGRKQTESGDGNGEQGLIQLKPRGENAVMRPSAYFEA